MHEINVKKTFGKRFFVKLVLLLEWLQRFYRHKTYKSLPHNPKISEKT